MSSDSDQDIWEYKSQNTGKNLMTKSSKAKGPSKASFSKQPIIAQGTSGCTTTKTGKTAKRSAGRQPKNPVALKKSSSNKTKKGDPQKNLKSKGSGGSTSTCSAKHSAVLDCFEDDSPSLGLAANNNDNVEIRSPQVTPSKRPADGYCPFCQMPFRCLVIESPRWHTTECMDVPIISCKECPNGLHCDSTIPNHYRRYKHALLADSRAGVISTHSPEVASGKTDPGNAHTQQTSAVASTSNYSVSSAQETRTVIHKSPYFDKEINPTKHTMKPSGSSRRRLFDAANNDDTTIPHKIPKITTSSHEAVPAPNCDTHQSDASIDSDQSGDIFFDAKEGIHLDQGTSQLSQSSQSREESMQVSNDLQTSAVGGKTSNEKCHEESRNVDPSIDIIEINDEHSDESNDDKKEGDSDVELIAMLDTPFDDVEVLSNDADSRGKFDAQKRPCSTLVGVQSCPNIGTHQTSLQRFFSCSSSKSADNAPERHKEIAKPGSLSWSSIFGRKPGNTSNNSSNNTAPQVSTLARAQSFTRSSNYQGKRQCPFYKKMPGTPFTVDAFRYGSVPECRAYFLTHFHYDHYGGLTRKFRHPIYCTKITGNLVQKKLGVDRQFIKTIALNTPTIVEGIEVEFMEANHCPGSVIILFKVPNGDVILHTGDFRACVEMEDYSALKASHINQVYLDTTYCDPAYAFPPQKDAISFAVEKASEFVHQNPDTLIVVGSYTIGKERIFMAIAEDLNSKIFVTREKKNVIDCLENSKISSRITLVPYEARVHVLPMGKLKFQNLSEYIKEVRPRYTKILAFEPTGWTHGGGTRHIALDKLKPKYQRDNVTIYGVPYSEHSSYTEMKRFCQFVRPDRIIPTVNNGDPASRKKMEAIFAQWMKEDIHSPGRSLKQKDLKSWFK